MGHMILFRKCDLWSFARVGKILKQKFWLHKKSLLLECLCGEYHNPMFKKLVVFSLISVGNKHKIILTQEDIFWREIVEVEFMGQKIKEQTFGRKRQRWETSERNLGNEIEGKENMGLQSWGDIEEKKGREKGDN